MKRTDLTNRQREILEIIERHLEEHGYPPTVREIGEACRLKSPRSVTQHLDALERKGFIRRKKDKSRAIEVVKRAANRVDENRVVSMPLVGSIAAGTPAYAVEDWEEVFALDKSLFGDREAFLLRARGESMTGAHIVDGDLLIVDPAAPVREGDIVAALIGEDATVKRLARSGDDTVLVPANEEVEPIVLDPRDGTVRIVGKVIGLIRRFG